MDGGESFALNLSFHINNTIILYTILDTNLLILCEKKHILITLMDLMVVSGPIRRGDISSHGGMARGSIELQVGA